MASNLTVTVSAKVSWWVRPFIALLPWACCITRWQPDVERLGAFIVRYGMKTSIKG